MQLRNERLKVDHSNVGTSRGNGPAVEKGCVEKMIGWPSGLNSINWEGNAPIIIEENTSLPSTGHKVISIVKSNGKNEVSKELHGPGKTKGSITIKNKALSIKEVIKKRA